MDRFCEDLRFERERRNISIETIGDAIKVSPQHLRALEAGHYAELPKGIFRKGIVRGYLGVLGVDELPWLQRFDAVLAAGGYATESSGDLTEFAENVSRSRPEPQSLPEMRWLGVTVMLLAVGLLGWCVWRFVLYGRVTLSSVHFG